MEKNKLINFQIFSIILEIILGALFHFTFEWSNQNALVGAFSSVNESTWEHLKLAFFPMLLTAIIGFFVFNENKNFFCSKAIGIITTISFITIFFYSYTGILGRNLSIIDILSFVFAIILGEYISYKRIVSNTDCNNTLSLILLTILFFLFIFFTYNPPKIALFQDPLTGLYGIF